MSDPGKFYFYFAAREKGLHVDELTVDYTALSKRFLEDDGQLQQIATDEARSQVKHRLDGEGAEAKWVKKWGNDILVANCSAQEARRLWLRGATDELARDIEIEIVAYAEASFSDDESDDEEGEES